MYEQARRSSPPNRVRYPTDRQFALSCSPPCFAATQLPSATELWLSPAWTFTMLLWRLHGRTHSGQPRIKVRGGATRNPGKSNLLGTCFRGYDGWPTESLFCQI